MTAKEVNRDIKRLNNLVKSLKKLHKDNNEAYFRDIEKSVKPEFKRLYNADDSFNSFNLESVKIMLRLNLSFRFVSLHTFGLNIDI